MNILSATSCFLLLGILVAVVDGQKRNSTVLNKSGSNNETTKVLEASFGTSVCKGRQLLFQRFQKDADYCIKVSEMNITRGIDKKASPGNPKLSFRNNIKCTISCLWQRLGLTEDDDKSIISKKTNAFVSETFPGDIRQQVVTGIQRCISDEKITQAVPQDKKRFDSCTQHLHLIRCFKSVITKACTGTGSKTSKPTFITLSPLK